MMKKYTRTSAESYVVGDNYKRQVIVKHFKDEEGLEHEFTTFGDDYAKSVHVIAFTKDNKVVLVNQFRSGPERWLYDFPGGLMEKGEIPLEAALRELGEETGYIPGHIDNIGNFPVDGYTNFTVEVFLATDCVFVEERLQRDETERQQGMYTDLVSVKELLDIARRGDLNLSGMLLMALDEVLTRAGYSKTNKANLA